jgi:release factor glutamine methyltransferase
MASEPEQWTIGRLLTWTADFLKRHGSESPRLDAEVLLAHARGCRRIELYTAFHDVVDDSVRSTYRETVKRRSQGTPVAYLVGQREFFSLSFLVTPDVLIPRPETEHVVLALIEVMRSRPADAPAPHIADVGTGSGILAVCAARHVAGCRVTATDIQPAALDVARRNVQQHQVDHSVELLYSDVLQAVPAACRFDAIVSNPPYVSDAEYQKLAADVRHEPKAALVAGPTGLEMIQRLVAQAAERLLPGGWLIVEISPMLADRVQHLLETHAGFNSPQIHKDLAGLARVVVAQRVAE